MTVVSKSNLFRKRLHLFISDKGNFNNNKIILPSGDNIINNTSEICEIVNNSVANIIGFDDSIPTNYYIDKGCLSIINKRW